MHKNGKLKTDISKRYLEIEVHINERSVSMLARNIVLLVLAAKWPQEASKEQQIEHALLFSAVWCNLTLSKSQRTNLDQVLDELCKHFSQEDYISKSPFPWLFIREDTYPGLVMNLRHIWWRWKTLQDENVKANRLGTQFSETGLEAELEEWRKHGALPISTAMRKSLKASSPVPKEFQQGDVAPNPTFYDVFSNSARESTGPFAAFPPNTFKDREGLSQDVLRDFFCTLLPAFSRSLAFENAVIVEIVMVAGDPLTYALEPVHGDGYDIICASSLAETHGALNVPLVYLPLLKNECSTLLYFGTFSLSLSFSYSNVDFSLMHSAVRSEYVQYFTDFRFHVGDGLKHEELMSLLNASLEVSREFLHSHAIFTWRYRGPRVQDWRYRLGV